MISSTSVSRKLHKFKAPYLLLCFLILLAVYVMYFSSTRENAPTPDFPTPDAPTTDAPTTDAPTTDAPTPDAPTPQLNNQRISENHVLCVLVPYRERFEELIEFVPHMSKFLNRQSIVYHIIVINHISDGYRFNRGSAFNAGFLISREKFPECDYIALHDIDMLPLTNEVSYDYPRDDVYHAIPPGFHPVPLYSHRDYVGGIFLISNKVYSRMNGFANFYWGWGFEDIDFRRRMTAHSVQMTRPVILNTDRSNSFKHIHGKSKQRDSFWCQNQAAAFYDPDRFGLGNTGLSDVKFTLASETYLSIEGFPCYVFNINIKCIFEKTPWCRPFCIDDVPTTSPSVWDLDGEVVWDRLIALGSIANSTRMSWNRIMNRNKNTNSGMPADSESWDRLLSQASPLKKEK